MRSILHAWSTTKKCKPMPVLERSAVLPFFLKTALLLAATAVCVTAVLVANLLHLPKGWLFVLPGLVVFVLTLGFGFYRINKFRRQARVANLAPSHWFAQGIFLFVVTLVLIVVLDGVWFLIDSSLAHAYAAALAEAKLYLPAQTWWLYFWYRGFVWCRAATKSLPQYLVQFAFCTFRFKSRAERLPASVRPLQVYFARVFFGHRIGHCAGIPAL